MKHPVHWKAKVLLMMRAVGAVTPSEFANKVYPNDPDLAERLPQNLKNWEATLPVKEGGPKRFFDDIIPVIKCRAGVTPAEIIQSRLDTFIGLLPPDRQGEFWIAIDEAVQEGKLTEEEAGLIDAPPANEAPSSADVGPHPRRPHYFAVNFATTWSVEGVRDSIEAGRFDHRYYYLTPDAAAAWDDLIRADLYPTYDQCRGGLRALMRSEEWEEAVRASPPETVVMLAGGGSPSKDLLIIEGLLAHPSMAERSIAYHVLDISPFMLFRTQEVLRRSLPKARGGSRVKPDFFGEDVLALQHAGTDRLRGPGTTLFFITGGTIGNLKEKAFFASLNRVSRRGDLLVISADTVSSDPSDEALDGLRRKYDHTELHRFLAPALRNLAHELRLPESDEELFARVEVEVVEGAFDEHTDVPGSRSVTLGFETGNGKMPILTSTRYVPDSLNAFADALGWKPIVRVSSPGNSDYQQFLFRRA